MLRLTHPPPPSTVGGHHSGHQSCIFSSLRMGASEFLYSSPPPHKGCIISYMCQYISHINDISFPIQNLLYVQNNGH